MATPGSRGFSKNRRKPRFRQPNRARRRSRKSSVPIVLAAYPHDPAAFTQGLLLDGGTLFESTGLEGRSTLREVDLASGNVVRRHDVPPDVAGGTLYGDLHRDAGWRGGVAQDVRG